MNWKKMKLQTYEKCNALPCAQQMSLPTYTKIPRAHKLKNNEIVDVQNM